MNKKRILKKVEKKLGLKYKPKQFMIWVKSDISPEMVEKFRKAWHENMIAGQKAVMFCPDIVKFNQMNR